MQDKQKVTLYLPPDLHRKLKIRAAVDSESMSTIAEKAIGFYIDRSDAVDEIESSHGRVHRVYSCPECSSSVVVRDGELVSLKNQPSILAEEELSVEQVPGVSPNKERQEEEQLIPC